MRRFMTYLLAGLAACAPLAGMGAAPTPLPPACTAPEYRQFDFWVGKWVARDAHDHSFAGTNTITHEMGGCVVQEHWKDSSGMIGSSFNIFEGSTGKWHQTWVDSQGSLLVLSGGMKNGDMVLSGETPLRRGGFALDRITWTPMKNGTVRQHWERSRDNGKTWKDVFDGIYSRA